MNKDYDLKSSTGYDSRSLKGRIADLLKDTRDDTEEVKNPRAKSFPIIPVTGGRPLKYLNNKSPKEF